MGKFDSNKHKMPDTKDANAVRNHIKAKYVEKKYYKQDNNKNKEQSDNDKDESEDDSSEDNKKKKKKKAVTKNEEGSSNVVLKPVVNNNTKLNPLYLKKDSNKQQNSKTDDFDPNGFEFTDSKKNDWNNIWDNKPTSTKNDINPSEFVFVNETNTTHKSDFNNFLQTQTQPQAQVQSNNNNVMNLFYTQPTTTSNTVTPTVQIPNNNNINNLFKTTPPQSTNTFSPPVQTNSGSHINNLFFQPETMQQPPQQVNQQKSPITSQPFDFTNIKQTTQQPEITKQPSKNIDDLDRMLRETNLNSGNPNSFSHANTNVPNPNFMMNPQLMQQFQMMMMNPQMQQNPQMMQSFMQMMMQSMNMGMNQGIGGMNMGTGMNISMNPNPGMGINMNTSLNTNNQGNPFQGGDLFTTSVQPKVIIYLI